MSSEIPNPVDGDWQMKSAPQKTPRAVKGGKMVRSPRGSGPFTNDEVARGYRFHSLDTAVTNPNAMQNAGKDLDRELHQ